MSKLLNSILCLGYAVQGAKTKGNIAGREAGIALQITEGFVDDW